MSTTAVMPCDCTLVMFGQAKSAGVKRDMKPRFDIPWFTQKAGAAYQNIRYGLGRRLHNIGGKGTTKTATCTVCGATKQL
jgi:hypothetical protein